MRAFRAGPFLTPVVLVLLLAAVAGLFAGSYTAAMANPTPRDLPVAVVGDVAAEPGARAFVRGLEDATGASVELRPYATYAQARNAVEEQRVFAILRVGQDRVRMDLSGAAGASVARLLTDEAPRVAKRAGVALTVRDIKPMQSGDPQGLALFYITLAAVIIGFMGALQLSVHAPSLNPAERVGFTVAYALLGGFAIYAVVDWQLEVVRLPFPQSWLTLALTMFTSGMVFTMFNTLLGRWAVLPTWLVMVVVGNPSSGGAVSWPLLPSPLGEIGRWLPPGASVNAQHTAVYFAGHQHPFPYLVLAGWAIAGTAVFWTWRHRHPGGREPVPGEGAPAP
ncbi:ABC transporter permease [Streptomyces sp. WMMC500]|uniref:ABC transporter permease n=1 Tax=Streptomyces sp. WMMC500 TaxID=3015154 RepID=UPI00248B4A12|nr:ABC transporter permease [Streptomyces sp. WMMC500]WBB64526.1 ABC transporter permease [Streptomyces sp. WMMC500]